VIAAGTCSAPTAWFPLSIQSDPDLLNGDHLKAILIASGIPVDGQVRLGAVDPAHATVLVDLKQDLLPAVTLMNHHSQNFYGEQLLRLIAIARGQEGSIAAGHNAVLAVLTEHFGASFTHVSLLDGCGLSYGNQASAGTMAHLLDAMLTTPVGDAFLTTLKERPYAGVRGRVKTGTLAIATCLVGYLDTRSGRRYAFAILLNKADATSLAWAPKLRDLAYGAIAGSLP
jgi:D-alanyl-D-alanine carboxypeptidase/D-alanyl-D-alanine-endopeptidase (penicillin-binding protein 4)